MLYLEILGTIVGLAYLWLEYKANIYLWIAGIVMPAIYIFVYYYAGFYADMGINIYYLLAGLYGLAVWMGCRLPFARKRGGAADSAVIASEASPSPEETAPQDTAPAAQSAPDAGKDAPRITRTPRRLWLPLAGVAAAAFGVITYILLNYTDSDVAWGDSFTTALSIVALWMLARKYVEQWLVWIVVDVACCALYVYKGLYPTAGLYGLYSVVAVMGYYKWLCLMKEGK